MRLRLTSFLRPSEDIPAVSPLPTRGRHLEDANAVGPAQQIAHIPKVCAVLLRSCEVLVGARQESSKIQGPSLGAAQLREQYT